MLMTKRIIYLKKKSTAYKVYSQVCDQQGQTVKRFPNPKFVSHFHDWSISCVKFSSHLRKSLPIFASTHHQQLSYCLALFVQFLYASSGYGLLVHLSIIITCVFKYRLDRQQGLLYFLNFVILTFKIWNLYDGNIINIGEIFVHTYDKKKTLSCIRSIRILT